MEDVGKRERPQRRAAPRPATEHRAPGFSIAGRRRRARPPDPPDLACQRYATLGFDVDPIDEAWATVEAAWGDEEAHRRFLGVCTALERLPEAGKRYRRVRESDPARAEVATKQIDRLLGLATQQLEGTRVDAPTTEHKRTLSWVAFFMMLLLMGAGTWLLMRG